MRWFGGGDRANVDSPPVIAAPPRRAPAAAPLAPTAPAPRKAQGESAAGAPKGTHYATFGDVPKFSRVFGDDQCSVCKLPESDRKHLALLEQPGRRVQLVAANDETVASSVLEYARGALRTANYEVLPLATAPASVIAEIYLASASSDSGGGKTENNYMQVVRQWIEYAVANRATDIHLETKGSGGTVRMRIDGELEAVRNDVKGVYPAAFVERCMASLFNNEQLRRSGSGSLFDATRNAYCMVPYTEIPGHGLRLRFQSLKGNEGPKTILRLLTVNENARTLTFEELGYARSHIELWKTAMNTPSGAVLTSGVTGSGKSTTQKSFIELNPAAPTSCILTVEDPVEYPIRHAHQIPIQRDLSNPGESARVYAETIAALMRSDPDVVMLGEIRDRFSAMALQQLVESGHMALGTVHAHLLSGIVPRLVNPEIGLNRDVLTAPNMLTLLVYQALVPVLCPHCAMTTGEALNAGFEDIAAVVQQVSGLRVPTDQMRWKRQCGCERCKGRGTVGQTVVAEMLMPDEDWLRPIRESRDVDAVEVYRGYSDGDLMSADMTGKTVFEHTLHKALCGTVDARQCARFDNFARFAGRYKQLKTRLRAA